MIYFISIFQCLRYDLLTMKIGLNSTDIMKSMMTNKKINWPEPWEQRRCRRVCTFRLRRPLRLLLRLAPDRLRPGRRDPPPEPHWESVYHSHESQLISFNRFDSIHSLKKNWRLIWKWINNSKLIE